MESIFLTKTTQEKCLVSRQFIWQALKKEAFLMIILKIMHDIYEGAVTSVKTKFIRY